MLCCEVLKLMSVYVCVYACVCFNRWSMVFSGLYLVFLFTMARRMLQGPQDEGAGKARDALDLQRFSGLSFDDIAGQENAKQEVGCTILYGRHVR